ncbi:MAG: hypothetical protein OEM41_08315, partial [Ignavibacteria bacterium]|nr:hypothetical protein [Ignavibacteria bacterium]
TVTGYSFKVCIESYQEKYPGWQNFQSANRVRRIDRREASTTPPDGNMYWVLPQGTFNLIIEVYYHDLTLPTEPPRYLGYFRRTIVIDRPHWNWQTGGPDYEFAVPFGNLITNPALLITDGTRPCFQPTPSVGIGALNIRLHWNAPADIDLWVIDPCGNKIFWDHDRDTCNNSIGRLDQDNWCDNLLLGRPENIFWRSNPPTGLYQVYVHYFDDSGGQCHPTSAGPVYYTVRWTLKGTSSSKSGTLPAVNANVLVTEFTY